MSSKNDLNILAFTFKGLTNAIGKAETVELEIFDNSKKEKSVVRMNIDKFLYSEIMSMVDIMTTAQILGLTFLRI